MHFLVVNNVIGVSFQLSGKAILNFLGDVKIILSHKACSKIIDLNARSQVFTHIYIYSGPTYCTYDFPCFMSSQTSLLITLPT